MGWQCLEAVETGECTPECAEYEDIPGCKCQRSVSNQNLSVSAQRLFKIG
jgi:hypothetical protein